MSAQDKARELLAQERHQDSLRHETMVERAAETAPRVDDNLEEKARELLAEERLQYKRLGETMLERSVEALKN